MPALGMTPLLIIAKGWRARGVNGHERAGLWLVGCCKAGRIFDLRFGIGSTLEGRMINHTDALIELPDAFSPALHLLRLSRAVCLAKEDSVVLEDRRKILAPRQLLLQGH